MFFLAQLTSNDTTIIGIGTAIAGGLTTAVVFLFKLFVEEKKLTRKDLEECRIDRQRLDKELAIVQAELVKIAKGN